MLRVTPRTPAAFGRGRRSWRRRGWEIGVGGWAVQGFRRYAGERLQGRVLTGPAQGKGRYPALIWHPRRRPIPAPLPCAVFRPPARRGAAVWPLRSPMSPNPLVVVSDERRASDQTTPGRLLNRPPTSGTRYRTVSRVCIPRWRCCGSEQYSSYFPLPSFQVASLIAPDGVIRTAWAAPVI